MCSTSQSPNRKKLIGKWSSLAGQLADHEVNAIPAQTQA